MGKSKVVSVWLPVDLVAEIDRCAGGYDTTRNRFIRTALEVAVAGGLGDSFCHDGLDPVVLKQPAHGGTP